MHKKKILQDFVWSCTVSSTNRWGDKHDAENTDWRKMKWPTQIKEICEVLSTHFSG